MKFLSRGDRIADGHYIVHSRFERVMNYTCKAKLLSLVDAGIGNGPVNMVVENNPEGLPAKLFISQEQCVFGAEHVVLSDVPVYDSKLQVPHTDVLIISQNLATLKQTLARSASEYSLAFLFEESRKSSFSSAFEKNLLKSFEDAFSALQNGELVTGIRKLSGLGQGLTPAGDDFIAGILLALHLKEIISGRETFRELRFNIAAQAKTGNIISRSAIEHAANGHFAEHINNFAQSCCTRSLNENDALILQILNVGESSGADMLSGFLFTFASEKFTDSRKNNIHDYKGNY